jgi:glycosyltransferase involved in cell wall biosynthesis
MNVFPKVSVITPVYNGAGTLEDCIRSVVAQDYPNIEHIVADGASTDGTLNILQQFEVDVVSEKDSGVYHAFNKGVSRATGEYIHILNSDDMYKSSSVVGEMVAFMITGNFDVGHGKVNQVNAEGKLVRVIGHDVTRKQLLKKCKVAHPAVFIKRTVYEKFGNYSVGFKIAADYEFFLRIWGHVSVGYLPEVITTMRLGGVSNSQVVLSYRECMAAALLHGERPLIVLVNYYFELIKAGVLKLRYMVSS